MDIMELGAIGELVGGLAVIGSLIYVGLQVRQTNTQAKQRNEIERAESHRVQSRDGNALFVCLTEPGLANVFRRGLNDFRSLSFDEQGQLDWWLSSYTIHTESVEFVAEGGLIDSSLAERWHLFLVSVIKSPGGAFWWSTTKTRFHPVFVEVIDGMAGKADSPTALNDTAPWLSAELPTPQEA